MVVYIINRNSICILAVGYVRLCLLEETEGNRITSSAAHYIGYDQKDLAYDLLNEPVCSLDVRGLDYIASRNILPQKQQTFPKLKLSIFANCDI